MNAPHLEASGFSLAHDAFGKLVLTLPSGERVAGVLPARCFPFSAPGEWIALLDPQGRELCCLKSLDGLAPASREAIERELAAREFMPRIERILGVTRGPEPTVWQVATDRGERQFTLSSDDHIRRLPPNGALIGDAQGVRYRIVDIAALDARSRRFLGRYL